MSERQYGGHFSFKDAATPAASGDVEAALSVQSAKGRLLEWLSESSLQTRELVEAALDSQFDRGLAAGAIRGEHAGALDVERLARALRNLAPIVYEALPDIARESAEALAAEYERLGAR